MSDVSFEEGAGVTLVPGGGTKKFRALLRVLDTQATTKRESDGSPVVRCSRKVCCALRPEGDDISFTLSSVGPIDFATRLCTPRKDEILHAIVSWRSKKDLVLLAFCSIDSTEAVAFKEIERKLRKDLKTQIALKTPKALPQIMMLMQTKACT